MKSNHQLKSLNNISILYLSRVKSQRTCFSTTCSRAVVLGPQQGGDFSNLEKALAEWRAIVGEENMATDEMTLAKELSDCSGNSHKVPAILYPHSTEHVCEILRVANQYKIPVNAVSSGNNWGYGSGLPASTIPIVQVKMNRMTVIDMDPIHGVIILKRMTWIIWYQSLELVQHVV